MLAVRRNMGTIEMRGARRGGRGCVGDDIGGVVMELRCPSLAMTGVTFQYSMRRGEGESRGERCVESWCWRRICDGLFTSASGLLVTCDDAEITIRFNLIVHDI